MDGDLAWGADYLVVGVHVGGAEINEDVDDKHDVDNEVDNDDGAVIVQPLFIQQERGHVRGEDGRVDDEQQDNPVPDCFERRIMQYCPFVDPGFLQLVFR